MKQSIHLSSVRNARELGGYAAGGKTVRYGCLLRTAALTNLSPEDSAKLQNEFHLAAVVDFRMNMERERAPEPVIPGAENCCLSLIEETQDYNPKLAKLIQTDEDRFARLKAAYESGRISDKLYVSFLFTEHGKAGYRRFFDCLLSLPEGRACLWHCTDGKDRTGVAAMLVLTALGADRDTILQDYLLTNEYNAARLDAVRDGLESLLPTPELRELALFGAGGVFERYMTNAMDAMEERCGSAEGYLKQELGLNEAKLEILREKFLE